MALSTREFYWTLLTVFALLLMASASKKEKRNKGHVIIVSGGTTTTHHQQGHCSGHKHIQHKYVQVPVHVPYPVPIHIPCKKEKVVIVNTPAEHPMEHGDNTMEHTFANVHYVNGY